MTRTALILRLGRLRLRRSAAAVAALLLMGVAVDARAADVSSPGRPVRSAADATTVPARSVLPDTHPAPWVGAWTTALTPPGSSGQSAEGFTDRTLRMVVHLSAGGDQFRLRFSNAYGERPLDVGPVTVARRAKDAAVVPGTLRRATFLHEPSTTVPVGAEAVTDPVRLSVRADTDLVVSFRLPTTTGPTTWHPWASQTSYISTSGDHTADASGAAFPERTTSWFFLRAVDVAGARAAGTVVAFGDSITEGGATTTDTNQRWPDVLARRLAQLPPSRRLSVVNAGIGGNRLLTDAGPTGAGANNLGRSAESRFDRDALTLPAVRDVIVSLGNNDLGSNAGVHPGEPLTASQLIAGFGRLAARARAAGARVHLATITPNGKLDARAEKIRTEVNQWIRSGDADGSVIDFDAAVRDPADPHRLLPAYNSGDTVHPNDAGLRAMAECVRLSTL
ncbi:GDSL-type esterase/lipase family protein [Streptomyces sp. NBC_00440]|uniref:SGNH/GDSL hydrolase family protein n=1 Tax=Streptomyces sp. NBC_00440 TaxID=2975741 RepID=UPI002E23D410